MEAGISRKEPPLVVIVGPTASGKTSLAIELAEKHGGEIICADSRTIYKDMNIGTAKPTFKDRARVPHWGLDVAMPGERFTAADFKTYAEKKIEEIRSRGHVPFLVGGTGLYIDGVLFDYQFGPEVDVMRRQAFELMTIDQLHDYCSSNNITLPENAKNKRYVIRAIERHGPSIKVNTALKTQTYVVGIATGKETLRTRIQKRTEQLFQNGVVEEATLLGKKYGWDSEAMTGNIYRLVRLYLSGEASIEEIKERNTTMDWRLAKRQLTWFRRNPHIEWLTLTEARTYVNTLLANRSRLWYHRTRKLF
jgi:tRNA dimethylallyltransferase